MERSAPSEPIHNPGNISAMVPLSLKDIATREESQDNVFTLDRARRWEQFCEDDWLFVIWAVKFGDTRSFGIMHGRHG